MTGPRMLRVGASTTAGSGIGLPASCRYRALSLFSPQRAVDGAASPNTIVTLEFRKLDQAQAAIASEHLKTLLQELGSSTADRPKAVLVERSPFTPVPIRPET